MIPRLASRLLSVLLLPLGLLTVSSPASAGQGLVQIAFEGRMDGTLELGGQEFPIGGRVEIEVGALREGEQRKVELDLFLAHGTSGAELGAIVAERLSRAGFDVLASPVEAERSRGSLFVEDALFVHLRTEYGMLASVTVCEGAPSLLRLVEPIRARGEETHLVLAGAVHTGHGKGQEGFALVLPVGEKDHPAQLAERLMNQAAKLGHQSDRPQPDSWRPIRTGDGGVYTGFEIRLTGRSDWRIEVTL